MFHFFTNPQQRKKRFNNFQKTMSSISLTEAIENRYNDIWVGSLKLKRTSKPNLTNEYHRENSLHLTIIEARNVANNRRYYCDIRLNRTLYARTTSKLSSPEVYWAEEFDLNNLPNMSVMTISLYQDVGNTLQKERKRITTSKLSIKKYRKSQNQLVGYITIPLSEISSVYKPIQTWVTLKVPDTSSSNQDVRSDLFLQDANDIVDSANYSNQLLDKTHIKINCESNNNNNNNNNNNSSSSNDDSFIFIANSHLDEQNVPQLRINARYQSLDILPLSQYSTLKMVVREHSLELSTWLECTLNVEMKEQIAHSLVSLHEHYDTLVDFLTNLVVEEVCQLENDSMVFRSNTMATKSVEFYMKQVGSSYLYHLLHLIIQRILECSTAWEVDPRKLSSSAIMSSLTSKDTEQFAKTSSDVVLNFQNNANETLITNQLLLLNYLDTIWRAIQSSLSYFPASLSRLFGSFRKSLEAKRGPEFCDNIISACIFLRFICPALLSPSLFGLLAAFPSKPAHQRNLTLLAKSLQTIANFSTFEDKEFYMRFLNGYVNVQLPHMRMFIRIISSPLMHLLQTSNFHPTNQSKHYDKSIATNFKGTIDEAYELANLQSILYSVIFNNSNKLELENVDKVFTESKNQFNPDLSITSLLPQSLLCLPQILYDIKETLINYANQKYVVIPDQSNEPIDRHVSQNKKTHQHTKLKNMTETYSNSQLTYDPLHDSACFNNSIANTNVLDQCLIDETFKKTSVTNDLSAISDDNEYDEPYFSPSNNRKHFYPIATDTSCINMVTCLNKRLSNEEKIYDTVPLSSESSSIEDLSSKLPQVSITNNNCKPIHLFVDGTNTSDKPCKQFELAKTMNYNEPNQSKFNHSLQKPHSQFCPEDNDKGVLVDSQKKALSPKMFQKQTTTANIILTKSQIVESSQKHVIHSKENGFQSTNNCNLNMETEPLHMKFNFEPEVTALLEPNSQTSDLLFSKAQQPKIDNLSKSPCLESPKDLTVEIVRLRYELLLSRQEAFNTADRLSKQQTEIHNLRQLLEQLRNQQSSLNIMSNTKHSSNVVTLKKEASVDNNDLMDYSTKINKNTVAKTATFDELDDAMARLEREQTELIREQARIRARIPSAPNRKQKHNTNSIL